MSWCGQDLEPALAQASQGGGMGFAARTKRFVTFSAALPREDEDRLQLANSSAYENCDHSFVLRRGNLPRTSGLSPAHVFRAI